ncbi:aspartyl/asparaginyl beta-hydroxylase domain-containing protein [Candidatus Cyanaurora vandensis]|uniref:aspartyl/asparaginyl beta-hydroxylase domain-containing protein n=1 Tax=Candidatus Cyanaurora vandensis TaxID=2714958 RepID=UPI00257A0C91|nr:aspartyl/asparaginyl beta-hydroxylase domain-containing protein [Candidatus Cyanaurora vandensis]
MEGRAIFYEAEQFSFVQTLETHGSQVQAELDQLAPQNFIAWPEKYLYGKGWDIFGLYAFGIKIAQNCRLCPRTTALVEGIPDLVTAGFSSLAPGVAIAPHHGYPDGLLRCHLGLRVPPDCALRVGLETRRWQEGRCLVFDDTTEHEAWNRSSQQRIVLLLDFKAPVGFFAPPPCPVRTGLLSFFRRK